MAAHGIPVSAQEMIIRRRKDRFIAEIVPSVPTETRRRPPVAAVTGLPDICQISPALLLRPPLFYILKNCCWCLRLSIIYCFALRPWSQICVTCQSCWLMGSIALSCCARASCLVPVGRRHMYEMDMEHFANKI